MTKSFFVGSPKTDTNLTQHSGCIEFALLGCQSHASYDFSFDPASSQFHIRFRFAGQAFKRSLKTANQKDATAALARVEETLSSLQRGVLELPAEADPATFLLSGGKTKQRPQKGEKALTLGQLIDSCLKSLPEQAKEKTTLKTEATHIKHFLARLPMSKAVDSLTTYDIQQFINAEPRRKVGTKFIGPDAIKRHWDSLYLSVSEVQEVLDLVKKRARYPFLYPIFVFVAYTGARRSEMNRSTIDDFDLENGTVLIRERKRSRSRSTTYRRVELPSRCVMVMNWPCTALKNC